MKMPGFNRLSKRGLLIELNPYQVLVAGITRLDETPLVIDCAAEFDRYDDDGLQQWLTANFEKQTAWLPVVAGFVPPDALLQRESIVSRRLVEPDYLQNLVKDQYKIDHPESWKLATLSQLEGLPLAAEGTQRPALIAGVSHSDIHDVQQRLLDHRMLPYRLELGTLPLLGVIFDHKNRRNDKRAVVVVNIEQEHTVAYILGKEGVHTSGAVRHGFASIVQAARKEFGLTDAAAVRDRLHLADEELLLRATKFVRAIGRDLKPLVDSYEMTTGQPVGEIYCAYLPPPLAWITEPLAQVVGRTPFVIDCAEWMPGVNLQAAEGVAPFGPHWLGALSLIADLPGPKIEPAPKPDDVHQGPWHIDCRLSAQLPSGDLIRRKFIGNVVAASIAACVLILAFWQLYVSGSLRSEIQYWQDQVATHKRQFAELNLATKTLDAKVARLDAAYDLMGAPYHVSDLLLNFGRTRLPKMSILSINGFAGGVVVRGTLQEPSEQAAQTLKHYVEDLRKDPAIGPLFSAIVLTSLERAEGADTLTFEIACKLKGAPAT
ncbi:MAG TPA: hypothetical protein VHD61_09940 [Lacunisphaera sp.]|nr:hypothetical protein [Lacunisphaera sp.]